MPNPEPDLVGSAEVAELLDIDRSTLSRWVAAGKLTPVHTQRAHRGARVFKRADVYALMAEERS